MMKVACLGSLWVWMLAIGACGKAEAPVAKVATVQPAADTSTPSAPEVVAEATKAPAPATPATPGTPATPATPAEPDDKTLERTPGLTPTLPLVKAPAPSGESPAMGPNDAKVKVIVFSDFQCPVCRRAVEPLKKIVRDLAPDVQVIWKNHALPMHSRAEPAARAAMAAFRQGKFWELHDRLFEAQSALDDAAIREQAASVGLDMAQFDKDLADPKLAAQIAAEGAQAEALGAEGTPAFFVNGERTVGWGSMMGLKHGVEQARTRGAGKSAEAATREKDPAAAEAFFGPAPK